jgi:hypothetical protein
MGPPSWSFATDAHGCIMVRISMDPPNTSLWRDESRLMASSPQIVDHRTSAQKSKNRNAESSNLDIKCPIQAGLSEAAGWRSGYGESARAGGAETLILAPSAALSEHQRAEGSGWMGFVSGVVRRKANAAQAQESRRGGRLWQGTSEAAPARDAASGTGERRPVGGRLMMCRIGRQVGAIWGGAKGGC